MTSTTPIASEELFENGGYTNILQHCGQKFLILRFNFSAVSSNIDRMLDSFEEHCKDRFIDFADRYESTSSLPASRQELMERETAASGLSYINTKASFLKLNLYLIIDKYDNCQHHTLHLRHRNLSEVHPRRGILPLLLQRDKAATTGSEQALKRMFITGVSPITLDDVTSGFNIGSNFTTDPQFNGIVGLAKRSYAPCSLITKKRAR